VPRQFVDATAASGIAYAIGYRGLGPTGLVPQVATGGVAAGDYDGDGDVDLFITRGDIGPNLLYRNDGRGVFADRAAVAGLAFTATATENYRQGGPTFADVDGDRDLDLFIGGLFGDPSAIYANNGNGTFSDVTAGSGIDLLQADHNISAAFGDYDLDGDLDMFLAHWGVARNAIQPGDTEHLWRNDSTTGRIRFTSVSLDAGIAPGILMNRAPISGTTITDHTFTPTFARIDDDLYPDILSVADYGETRVFMNNGDGTFRDATDSNVITDGNGMGSALGDYDNDGDLDWFVTSIFYLDQPLSGNRFYRNDEGFFSDATDATSVRDGGWGWGACFADIDNDADLDIYHTNGWLDIDFSTDLSRMFEADGKGIFRDVARTIGLADQEQGRGVVCADFDGDGDIDIFQLHRGQPVSASLWRNDLVSRNYLAVRLNGLPPNTEAAGARIFVTIGAVTQMREITIGNNFVSQNPATQHFGVGLATQVDELRVEWPDGEETILQTVAVGRSITLNHPSTGSIP
jgi:hypothetical protein